MKKVFCCMFVLFAVLTGLAVGQYSTSYASGFADIADMTSTVNAWKNVAGGGVCKSTAISLGSPRCIGTDGYIYRFNAQTHSWQQLPALGTGAVALAVQNANNLYALKSAWQCGSPNYGIFNWNGSTWTQKGGCYHQIFVDPQGFLGGLNNAGQLFTSGDGGNTWSLQGGNWVYVNFGSGQIGCAVGADYSIWTLDTPSGGTPYTSPTKISTGVPSGSAVGCANLADPFTLLAWTSAGTVYDMTMDRYGSWQQVAGLSVRRISGLYTYVALGEDMSGNSYHWNVNARTISGTTTGSWTSCPGPGNICQPTAKHKGQLWVKFSSGHGINNGMQTQTIPATGSMDLTSMDINPGCDPLFGVPGDVECQVESSGGEQCLQSGASVPSPPEPPKAGESFDDVAFASAKTFSGPHPNGTPYVGSWDGSATINLTEVCPNFSVSTCPIGSPFTSQFRCVYADATGVAGIRCYQTVKQLMLDRLDGLGSPWSAITPYVTVGSNGAPPVCQYELTGPLIPYGIDADIMPDCN